MNIAAVIISVLALLFTVFSFWWMNWRKGKLHVSEPRLFAAIGSSGGRMIVELPFTFFNDGPTPIVIENLRLVFTGVEPKPLNFIAKVEKVGTDEGREFASQFLVLGREAKQVICEFQREQGFSLTNSKYPLKLYAQIDDRKEWIELSKFSLNVRELDAATINSRFLTHDNLSDS